MCQSARGLAQSKTLREFSAGYDDAPAFGLRQSSAAFRFLASLGVSSGYRIYLADAPTRRFEVKDFVKHKRDRGFLLCRAYSSERAADRPTIFRVVRSEFGAGYFANAAAKQMAPHQHGSELGMKSHDKYNHL
jgi:hypothetical protein